MIQPWYQQVEQIFGHRRTQLALCCLGKLLHNSYIVVSFSGFRRDYDSGIQFIESLYVSDKRCHLSFPTFPIFRENLRERESEKTKIMTRKVTWHYMAVSSCFSPYLSLSVFTYFSFSFSSSPQGEETAQ